ncbi:MAG: hypothetical protein IT437_05050, partial [Phycisphaerales bacterium]|nr:hypothetical protein [Phycisphaerales bacterium]
MPTPSRGVRGRRPFREEPARVVPGAREEGDRDEQWRLGVAVCGAAHAQTPQLGFNATEKGAAINRPDLMDAAACWVEDRPEPLADKRWVYCAGWVTLNDASGNPHKRLAVYKYDADMPQGLGDPPPPGYDQWKK